MTAANSQTTLLAGKRGSASQFVIATLPLLGTLIYLLYRATRIPNLPIYNLPESFSDDQWNTALEESGMIASMSDILTTFLTFHVLWTIFAVYAIVFIPKRRHLIGRYLAEGELCLGDVVYDKSSRFCRGLREYGFAVYAHPNRQKLIRKRVRVYQNYTRERVAILRLPSRPLSGQCKIDLEIDLSAATRERDGSLRYILQWMLFWVIFTLGGSLFVLTKAHDLDGKIDGGFPFALKLFLVVVGLNVPLSFAINWLRWIAYRNWMINRGAIIDDSGDARRVDYCMATRVQSEDGSDIIPYSILSEEEMSYQGTIPSHSSVVNDAENAGQGVSA